MNDSEISVQPVIEWPTGKPHVSFSELSDWILCSWRHKLIHIDKLGTFKQTPHLGFGTGVHSTNEHYIKTRVLDKSLAFNEIRKSWEENYDLFTKGPFPSWAADGFGCVDDWIKKADTITSDVPLFLDKMFPGWECVNAEEFLYEEIPDCKIKFKGYIDAIIKTKDKNGKDKFWIIDWKTCGWGWRKEKQEDFNVQLQLILYKHFWSIKNQINTRDVQCVFALLKRDGKPGNSVSLLPVSIGPTVIQRGLRVINNHVRAVEKGFYIKNRDSCKYCEFENTEHCTQTM